MERKQFYEEINKYLQSQNKEDIVNFVNNIIRKTPENKFEEIICMTQENPHVNTSDIKQHLDKYKKIFNKIENQDLYFYANQYEDFSYGWHDWNTEYTDNDNIGDFIADSVIYGVKLVNHQDYNYAKKIFDLVLNTNYTAFDEEIGETYELSLQELYDNNLITVNIPILCSYVIYVTYQISKNKVEDIYHYFKTNISFINVSIEDAFSLGSEQLTNIDEFFIDWIIFLSQIKGDTEYRLLKEALIYTNFAGYENYINEITKNQPKLFINIFKYLEEENKLDELITLGNKALKTIDSSLEIGSDIALYLGKVDYKNKEDYIIKSFTFKPNILNLLRIVNHGYFEKYENEIKNKITEEINKKNKENTLIDEDYCFLLYFFSGNFEEFYSKCTEHKELLGWTGSFIKIAVYLWLLLLNNTNEETKSYSRILSYIFSTIEYCEEESPFLGNDIYEIWINWKNNFKIDENTKNKVLKWLSEIIEKRVDAILKGNYRKSYHKAALLVVAYAELLSSPNTEDKENYLNYYTNKYPRRSAFRRELNNLL